jgi:REP element-mobilizing transposase RayT
VTIWQRNYFEHVIRNGEDLERVRIYIQENPFRWEDDGENPAAGLFEARG